MLKLIEYQIQKLKIYFLSPEDKLISIKLISLAQKVDFSIFIKVNDEFKTIEKIVYKKYPEYKEYENVFLVKGKKINKNKTFGENDIKDKDVLTLLKLEDDN